MDVLSATEPSPYERVPQGEPVPEWSEARQTWRSAWYVHVYGFASVFLIFAAAAAYRFSKLYSLKLARMSSGYHLKLSLYVSVLILSLLRSISLFGDAYNSSGIFPMIAAKILWSLAFPCLISAFTLLLVVLLATTNACHRRKSMASNYKHGIGMGCCLMVYTALVIAADWAVVYSQHSIFLLVVCQVFFIAWGSIVMIGYAMVAYKIVKDLAHTSLNVDRGLIRSFARLLVFCSAIGLMSIAAKFYAAVDALSAMSSPESTPDPWTWLAFQTLQRVLECSMCLLMILITGKADRKREIQIVPKILCNGVTVISGLESGMVLKEGSWKKKREIR